MTDERLKRLKSNLEEVRERIEAARGRSPIGVESVRLVAVTKYVDSDVARALVELGARDLGENRIQTAEPKLRDLKDLPVRWHWIGSLQTNKIRKILGRFHEIHSIDRPSLIEALRDRLESAEDEKLPSTLPVYLQVNLSGEAAKSGYSPDEAIRGGELLLESERFEWVGLMTLAPHFDDAERTRPIFAGLRELRESLEDRLGVRLPKLSMGMSNDFEVAVEEGATDVRIGSLLYEGLE